MILEKDFLIQNQPITIDKGSFEWIAPSNIALVKYWGKKENQIPANPSISFTLNNCKTITKLSFVKIHFDKLSATSNDFSFDLLFEGKQGTGKSSAI